MNFYFVFFFVLRAISVYDPNIHNLGVNLITNPLFQDPLLSNGTLVSFIPNAIPGWQCSGYCEISAYV